MAGGVDCDRSVVSRTVGKALVSVHTCSGTGVRAAPAAVIDELREKLSKEPASRRARPCLMSERFGPSARNRGDLDAVANASRQKRRGRGGRGASMCCASGPIACAIGQELRELSERGDVSVACPIGQLGDMPRAADGRQFARGDGDLRLPRPPDATLAFASKMTTARERKVTDMSKLLQTRAASSSGGRTARRRFVSFRGCGQRSPCRECQDEFL